MALDIKIEKRKRNFTEEKKEVYVATPDRNGVIDTEKMAKVIAKDSGRWFDVFSINRGTLSGVEVGMAVINEDGLIGRVYEAGLNYAKVMTIIDSRSAVACLIQRTRDNGVMKGQISAAASDSSE